MGPIALYEAVDMNTLPVGGRADRPLRCHTRVCSSSRCCSKAGANPNLQLKLFPPYRSLRDDRGADTLLTVGATPLLRAAKAGDVAGDEAAAGARREPESADRDGHHSVDGCGGQWLERLDTRGRYKTEAQAVEAVKVLLAAGVDINQRDNNGQTALYGAATWGWNDLVKTLAAHNADLTCQGRSGSDGRRRRHGDAGGSSGRATSAHIPRRRRCCNN